MERGSHRVPVDKELHATKKNQERELTVSRDEPLIGYLIPSVQP